MWLAGLGLAFIVLAAPSVRAGDKPADTPTVVVRVKSLDALLKNLNLVVRLVGQEEVAQQIEGLVKSKIGKKGLEGVDPSRPFGAYVRFGKAIDEVNGALLIPMVDEETFIKLLDNVGVNYAKDKDGIYTHKTNKDLDIYFRFANKYLYITTVKTESIQSKNLPDPAKALAIPGDATISLVARVDQIPDAAKLMVLQQLDEAVEAARKKEQKGETKIQAAARDAVIGDFHKLATRLVREAAEVRFDLDIDDRTKEMDVRFNVKAKPGTDLAKTIKNLGDLKSPLAGIVKKDVAFEGGIHLALPDAIHKVFIEMVADAKEGAVKGIQNDAKKAQARALFDAMMPTAQAGEFQLVAAVLGPKAERYTFIGALKLKDGDKLGKTAYTLLKDALSDIPEDQRGKIHLDFDSVGAVKIHKFDVPKDGKLDKFFELAGDNHLYIAFRDDALFLALGKEALPALKTALAKTDGGPSQPLVFDFDVARMAPLMAKTQEQKDLAARLFPDGANGRVRLAVDGGTSLTARLQMRLNVLEFLVKMKGEKQE
jgi:hypothetical protein